MYLVERGLGPSETDHEYVKLHIFFIFHMGHTVSFHDNVRIFIHLTSGESSDPTWLK